MRRGLLDGVDRGAPGVREVPTNQSVFGLPNRGRLAPERARRKGGVRASAEPQGPRSVTARRINGMSFLLARRLVEAGLPFVSIFWMEDPRSRTSARAPGGCWDTHKTFGLPPRSSPPRVGPFLSALLEDLQQRGLLTRPWCWSTARWGVLRRSATGRREAWPGRDPTTGRPCLSVLFAGGGVRGGQVTVRPTVAPPAARPVCPGAVARARLHAAGVPEGEVARPRGPAPRPPSEGRKARSSAYLK